MFARYHFRPNFHQHSSFRLVSSSTPAPPKCLWGTGSLTPTESCSSGPLSGAAGYETQTLLNQYLALHFPVSGIKEGVQPVSVHADAPNHALRFPQRVARKLVTSMALNDLSNCRALDLGCATGGSSFELAAAGFRQVVGIDFSQAFVAAAQQMQRGESVHFKIPCEGDLHVDVIAEHEANVDAAARARCTFKVGDACKLSEHQAELGSFDGAVLANLLCRLPEPLACLDGLQVLLKPGGVVVIVTPFSWLEQWTPRSKWLGGYYDPISHRPIHSKDVLHVEMEKRGFVKVVEEEMPLIIREHQRKYQYILSQATVWRRC